MWLTYINKSREISDMGEVKDATLRKLFVRAFNKLLTNRVILANFTATLRLVNDVKISGG